MCIPFGGVTRALFVAHKDMPNRAVHQWVVGRQDAPAGVAEHRIDVLILK